MFFEINRSLCEAYTGLDPLSLLDYPAEDVIELINHTLSYNKRHSNTDKADKPKVIRRPASDNWF